MTMSDTARSIAKLLSLLGHSIEIAHDGPTAIRRQGSADVLLLDIGLPAIDGFK